MTSDVAAPSKPSPQLDRLLGFLKSDPSNPALLADAASAAFDARAFDLAAELIARHAALGPLPPPLANLQGLIALTQQRFGDAAAIFTALRAQGTDDPVLRFNLAWCMAMTDAYRDAADLLDAAAIAASPRGAALRIQMLHHLELYDEALAEGEALAELRPNDGLLMGALASLSLDADKPDLAMRYALAAGDNGEGRAALGMLTLGAHDAPRALEMFDQAIASEPRNPRAWVGKGLGLLISGDAAAGAQALDKGAALFHDHIGSWIASGWAHFTGGQYDRARASFERALAIDANFSEGHGGLAVLDILGGKLGDARRRSEIALRLDKKSLGGALARSLLLEREGQTQMAQRIRQIALTMPIGPGGETITHAMLGFAAGQRRKP